MHTLRAMCLIKNDNAIIIVIKHVQNDICYMIIEKRSSSKFSCNTLHPFSSLPKLENATCIWNILKPKKMLSNAFWECKSKSSMLGINLHQILAMKEDVA